jgi:starch phosphorylase
MTDSPLVAYFSMEIGLDPAMPTYAGGLGILAGDTIRAAADLEVPLVAMTLLHRRGHFYQRLDMRGHQAEEPATWSVENFLEPSDLRVTVEIEQRKVRVRAWRYQVRGISGFQVPVYLLDTDLPENAPWDRTLTDVLYGGDQYYRLCQEIVLGLGGVRMLRALGYQHVARFHLNEGHPALLILGLLEERLSSGGAEANLTHDAIETVRERCVFTTHTPVPAGHDQFPCDLVRRVLGERMWGILYCCWEHPVLNMTDLALRHSRYINGVTMKHGEVSRGMFPGYPIHSITNGVHAVTWTAPSFQALYDRHLPDWRRDALSLRYAVGIAGAEIWAAHLDAKRALVEHVNRTTNAGFDAQVLTLGFARRAAAYKRFMLMFHDIEGLKAIARQVGSFQIVFAGKAHPHDFGSKEMIRLVHDMRDALRGRIAVAYLQNYDMALAKLMCAGVDVWLNTPLPPLEASGTSGMKAAMNGVPSLSVLDGWWIEGHVEGVTGWAIGDRVEADVEPRTDLDACHAEALYEKLAGKVIPCFYNDRNRFIEIMRHAIALNGSFFNTHRMVAQYLNDAYHVVGPYLRRGSHGLA